MPITSDQQRADIGEYNSRRAAIAASQPIPETYTPITDQDLFDGRLAQLVTESLQPLRDAEVRQKEAAVAAKDPKALEDLKAATAAKKQQADADYLAALTAAQVAPAVDAELK
jgi:hypothetical protein